MTVRTPEDRAKARVLLWALAVRIVQQVNDAFVDLGRFQPTERPRAIHHLADAYRVAFDCLDRLGGVDDGEETTGAGPEGR